MKTIGFLTSGGDAPGMNAALHAGVMTAMSHGIRCLGFERGYNGLLDNKFIQLNEKTVKHISCKGGTILKSARCKRLMAEEFQRQAAQNLAKLELDALVVIGGDGSFRGALAIANFHPLPIIGIPATIDNDIDGCDSTIGFQTAVQTATEAIDKIRDTADALERIFIVEVMGRHSGFIALDVGIATEAEQIIYPEMGLDSTTLIHHLKTDIQHYITHQGHASYIVVMAENSVTNISATELAHELEAELDVDCRALVLGHIQRGGQATSQDRVLASKLGYFAIESLLKGFQGYMVGEQAGQLQLSPIEKSVKHEKKLDTNLHQYFQRSLMRL